jgi:hypothetical protein
MRRSIAALALTAAALGVVTAPAAADELPSAVTPSECMQGGGSFEYFSPDGVVNPGCQGGIHHGAALLVDPLTLAQQP